MNRRGLIATLMTAASAIVVGNKSAVAFGKSPAWYYVSSTRGSVGGGFSWKKPAKRFQDVLPLCVGGEIIFFEKNHREMLPPEGLKIEVSKLCLCRIDDDNDMKESDRNPWIIGFDRFGQVGKDCTVETRPRFINIERPFACSIHSIETYTEWHREEIAV